jgi:hypothetical protein
MCYPCGSMGSNEFVLYFSSTRRTQASPRRSLLVCSPPTRTAPSPFFHQSAPNQPRPSGRSGESTSSVCHANEPSGCERRANESSAKKPAPSWPTASQASVVASQPCTDIEQQQSSDVEQTHRLASCSRPRRGTGRRRPTPRLRACGRWGDQRSQRPIGPKEQQRTRGRTETTTFGCRRQRWQSRRPQSLQSDPVSLSTLSQVGRRTRVRTGKASVARKRRLGQWEKGEVGATTPGLGRRGQLLPYGRVGIQVERVERRKAALGRAAGVQVEGVLRDDQKAIVSCRATWPPPSHSRHALWLVRT